MTTLQPDRAQLGVVPTLLINTGRSTFWNYSPDFYTAIKDLPALEDPPIFVFGK